MATVKGDIRQLTIKGRVLEVKTKSDFTNRLGGEVISDDDGNITNQGKFIPVKNKEILKISCEVVAWDGIFEFLKGLADAAIEEAIVVTYADGSSRAGTGMPVGNLEEKTQDGTISVTFMGSGKLELI